jgi:hypothetical protein
MCERSYDGDRDVRVLTKKCLQKVSILDFADEKKSDILVTIPFCHFDDDVKMSKMSFILAIFEAK